MPAQRWVTRAPSEAQPLGQKRVQPGLHAGRDGLRVGVLVLELLEPAAADHDPAVVGGAVVHEAGLGVGGVRERAPLQRLGGKHLAAHRVDDAVQLRQQARDQPVAGDHHGLGAHRPAAGVDEPAVTLALEAADRRVLEQRCAAVGGSRRQRTHPGRGQQLGVPREEGGRLAAVAHRFRNQIGGRTARDA